MRRFWNFLWKYKKRMGHAIFASPHQLWNLSSALRGTFGYHRRYHLPGRSRHGQPVWKQYLSPKRRRHRLYRNLYSFFKSLSGEILFACCRVFLPGLFQGTDHFHSRGLQTKARRLERSFLLQISHCLPVACTDSYRSGSFSLSVSSWKWNFCQWE